MEIEIDVDCAGIWTRCPVTLEKNLDGSLNLSNNKIGYHVTNSMH